MRYTVRPISDRSAFTGKTVDSPFTASWSDTLDLLDRELFALKAAEVVFEVDVANDRDIRLDGMLRADARVKSPAVRLAFESMHGTLTYATDRYRKTYYRSKSMESWQHNLRAIALGLEALRKVDRYGITRRGEQYAGWKALPPGGIALGQGMSRDQAMAVIRQYGPRDVRMDDWPRLLKQARAEAHPDRNEGNRILWDQVELAARVLGIAS